MTEMLPGQAPLVPTQRVPKPSLPNGPRAWLAQYPMAAYVLPMLVFTLLTTLEPKANEKSLADSPYGWYPYVYAVKLLATTIALWFAWPELKRFPPKVGLLAVFIGAIGAPLWIWLALAGYERHVLPETVLGFLGLSGARSSFNPFAELKPAGLAGLFLTVRFLGLVLIVPIIEEFFLRGFLMRYVQSEDFRNVLFGVVTPLAVAAGTLVPMLTHPGELLAAAVWFSLITWLMIRTRSLWDCIAAHAVTNLLMGMYVVASGHWELM